MGNSEVGVAPLGGEDPQGYGEPFINGGSLAVGKSFCLLKLSWSVLHDEASLAAVEIDWTGSDRSAKDKSSVG